MKANTISVINEKGGVGKTSVIWNTSYEIAKPSVQSSLNKPEKVLMIDLDGQRANLTWYAGIKNKDDLPTMYNVLIGNKNINDCIVNVRENLDIVPANATVTALSQTGGIRKMKKAVQDVQDDYSWIFIDVNPDPTTAHRFALAASDYVIIPMLPDVASLEGNKGVAEDILDIQDSGNPSLKVLGILFNKNNDRTNLSKQVNEIAKEMATQLNTTIFESRIRNAVVMSECPAAHIGVTEYDPKAAVSDDIRKVVKEIKERVSTNE